MLAGACVGFAWAAFLAVQALASNLAPDVEGKDVQLVGTVDSLPYVFDDGARFYLAVERGEGLPQRIALSWYGNIRGHRQEVGDIQPGQRWRFTARLQRPHGNANPYGFDYEAWLLEQGLRATGYVRQGEMLDDFVLSFASVVERTRAFLRARILDALKGKPYAPVIVALVIGDQRAIDQGDWQVFNRTGISHLVSISGLHITMVAGMVAFAVSAVWRRMPNLPLVLPTQKAAALAGFATALVYVLLAGFGVPAQRTLYMLSVLAWAMWTGRISSASHVLCAALFVVLLLDPWAVLWPGFWLSFGAVGVIMYASAGRNLAQHGGWRESLRLGARTQYVVTAGLVPLTILLFAQVSIASPLANAIAIPLVSFVVTPLALLGALAPPVMCGLLLSLAHEAFALLAQLLEWLAASPLSIWTAPIPPVFVFLTAVAGVAWLLAPRGWPMRWLGVLGCLPLLAAAPSAPRVGQMNVTAFDVGQGMALLIETAHHRLLYDTGPAYAPGADGANRVLLPYLRARGIATLDGIVVTHSDTDHSGGALTMLGQIGSAWVSSSLDEDHPIVQRARRHVRCLAGQHWEWDGVQFELLHPTPAIYADPNAKPNAHGCTLMVTAGSHRLLLAADIEAPQEETLLTGGRDLHADVLLAPHHGSGTSSTVGFLRAVNPAIAIFQVGYRNRYHHPKAEVFERYGDLGVRRLRTDESGALTLRFGDAIDVEAFRSAHARYWMPQ